jgi:AcrR family transcriptional regulator
MARTPKVVENRREQIIDAAINVFSQKGFNRTINQDIAHEAGITPGLIYHYFENKNALLQAIAETRSPIRLIHSLPADMLELPPSQFLPLLITQALEIVESETFVKLIRIFIPEMLHNGYGEGLAPNFTQFLGQIVGFFSGYYAHQQELGNIRRADPTFLAQMTLSCMIGFVMRRQVIGDPSVAYYTHEQLAMQVTEIIVNGIASR